MSRSRPAGGGIAKSATLAAALFAASCVGPREAALREASAIAATGGLEQRVVETAFFDLAGFERRGGAHGRTLVVYLEGDGRAWLNRYQVSRDPTPSDPVALRLAAADPATPLLYLARPCQYPAAAGTRNCAPRYWTDRRLGAEVVAAANEAIDRRKAEVGAETVELVGYSGGGALAALLAARRRDVAALVTVAADLDLGAWTAHHEVSSLAGSLDPVDFADRLAAVPQTHFVGGRDEVVPLTVTQSYLRALPPGAPVRVVAMPGFDHFCCWAEAWPKLLAEARKGHAGASQ